jgi:amidase
MHLYASLNFRYLHEKNYDGYYYGKCQNLRRELRQAYDEAFRKYDVLIMPTIPKKASKFPSKNPSLTGKFISVAKFEDCDIFVIDPSWNEVHSGLK